MTSETEAPDAIGSEAAVESARRLYDALADGDHEALAEVLDPGFRGHASEGLPLDLGGVHTGPDRMRRDFWGRIARHFRARAEPREFHRVDDGRLLVIGRYTGEGRTSGAPLDASFVHLLRFTGHRIAELVQYTDTARWARALTGEEAGPPPEPPPATRLAELTRIEFDVTDGLAHIRLNRPAARNALDARTADELLEAAHRCQEDPRVRAVLFSAAGPAFTVGGDIEVFAGAAEGELPALLDSMAGVYHRALALFSALDVPIVCGVHGAAAGGGLGLVYCADLVYAAERTRFALGFAALGLTSDGGTSWFLPRLIGVRRTAELFYEQRTLTAHEAAEWGLITRVVPDDTLHEEVLRAARGLAAGPTRAYAGMRRLLRASGTGTLTGQLAAEVRSLSRTAATADAAEAIASFIGKREPHYRGR
ncbi:enoyl-CoA hydratase-related protein [Streptomyces sp. NPDC004609]|uniref:enoyl-CoA hydratase-related protein n=1 Tax=Streptomyces sp. NPDC004609 TaxID=3364704 RepID=UPI0036B82BF2